MPKHPQPPKKPVELIAQRRAVLGDEGMDETLPDGVSLIDINDEHAPDQVDEPLVAGAPVAVELDAAVVVRQLFVVDLGEGDVPARRDKEDDAGAPDVDPRRVVRRPARDLRRDVETRPADRRRHVRARVDLPAEPKVRDLQPQVVRRDKEDVLRLEVAVDDVVQVEILQRTQNLIANARQVTRVDLFVIDPRQQVSSRQTIRE